MVTTRSDTLKSKKAEEEEVKSKRMKKDSQERRKEKVHVEVFQDSWPFDCLPYADLAIVDD